MNIPDRIKSELQSNTCVICCDQFVICKTDDIPKNYNVESDLEVDRERGSVLLRHIIKDDPQNPLYVEYFVTKTFVEKISRDKKIDIVFVDNGLNEKGKYTVKLMKEDIEIIRREIGLGT